ncbi:hypothetical protein [Phenylobacterium sp.]|jgi:hypothetical protein|uniref:hypothetical protein n=1 Tax=Phenylobacterium sp. TaxID=1871053 RepID=UPI002F947E1D
MAAYLLADTGMSGIRFACWAMDTLFPAHLMAAKALQKDIERRHGRSELAEDWSAEGIWSRARGRDKRGGVVDLPEGEWRTE